jgi:hypothetical protein
MNIFVLDSSPREAAQAHCDKHVGKMLLETAQLLSTAHRLIDGKHSVVIQNGRRKQIWTHPTRDAVLYKATHWNHPCAVWVRETIGNYIWAYELMCELGEEYKHRRGKTHATDTLLRDVLAESPINLRDGDLTPFALGMKSTHAHHCNTADPVGSYRAYYIDKQDRMKMVWTKREEPSWFTHK